MLPFSGGKFTSTLLGTSPACNLSLIKLTVEMTSIAQKAIFLSDSQISWTIYAKEEVTSQVNRAFAVDRPVQLEDRTSYLTDSKSIVLRRLVQCCASGPRAKPFKDSIINVKQLYDAFLSFHQQNGLFIPIFICIRRLVESWCRVFIPDNGPGGPPLLGLVKELIAKGHIDKRFLNSLENFIRTGNMAAHPDPQTASICSPELVHLFIKTWCDIFTDRGCVQTMIRDGILSEEPLLQLNSPLPAPLSNDHLLSVGNLQSTLPAPILNDSSEYRNDWNCPICNFRNFSFRHLWFRCSSLKPSEPGPVIPPSPVVHGPVLQPGDWICSVPQCLNDNFAWRTKCNICHTPRTQVAPPSVAPSPVLPGPVRLSGD